MPKHIIRTRVSSFVHSFNEEHILVVTTDERAKAKQFKSKRAADEWRDEHTDAGYGLASTDSYVEKL